MPNSMTPAERQARIDQLQADTLQMAIDTIKRTEDVRFAPWSLQAAGPGAASALFVAAIAMLKWLQH